MTPMYEEAADDDDDDDDEIGLLPPAHVIDPGDYSAIVLQGRVGKFLDARGFFLPLLQCCGLFSFLISAPIDHSAAQHQ